MKFYFQIIRWLLFVLFYLFLGNSCTKNDVIISGELKKWHKISISFIGPESSEMAEDNPFLDYRLDVVFNHIESGKKYIVPGYFAADGNAAQTGAVSGHIWRVHFCPDETGDWTFKATLQEGKNIAVAENISDGKIIPLISAKGSFTISASDKTGKDFRAKGRLRYVGQRYLQFAETIEWFLKGGADSPENFLAYGDFDDTYCLRTEMRQGEAHSVKSKLYENHRADWVEGDPTWQNGKGKGIIGALNYLFSKGMNSVYFLTMNVQGDGNDVWPWINENERTRFDCSKLDQWEIVFSHMDSLGIMKHFVTQETENELLLDIGYLGILRKLYYRELVARFSHHPGITWNLGEENGSADWTPKGQTDEDRKAMAKYLNTIDPYNNFLVVHTHSDEYHRNLYLHPMLGFEHLYGPSLQIHSSDQVHKVTKYWVNESEKSGHAWVVNLDEIGPANTGAKPDADDPDHDEMRQQVLWGNLMAGGAGVEWYFGYDFAHNDLQCEDWRSRDILWEQTKYALDFFQRFIPYWEMSSANDLLSGRQNWCLAKNGEIYAIYLPNGGSSRLKVGQKGSYTISWYNPRHGGELIGGGIRSTSSSGVLDLGNPPSDLKNDWAAIIKK